MLQVYQIEHEQGTEPLMEKGKPTGRTRRLSDVLGYVTTDSHAAAVTEAGKRWPGLKVSAWPSGMKIRERTRRDQSPPEGMRQKWDEVQVVGERGRVLFRGGTIGEAERFIIENEGR